MRVSQNLRQYLTAGLALIRESALFSERVDWAAVDQRAETVLARARCPADTHALLAEVLRAAGGPHSRLSSPQQRSESRARATAALGPALPTGSITDTVGYLRLPWLPAGWMAAHRYRVAGRRLLAKMVAERPGGWVVDLRDNVGGNMWPMLAVAAALLGEGVVGHFLVPGGPSQPWTLRHGKVLLDGRTMARCRVPVPADRDPVALLTSGRTASAGEAVAVAFHRRPRVRMFGAPTAGFTTGNTIHLLPDGTRLTISGSFYADRFRHPFTGPIAVDEDAADDRVLAEAVNWVRTQR